ncbi:MAG: flagellar brake protein [Chromatiaceae bacterium]|nr:flagellar brake protein [Gammaproteobacteria bacterium]MCP5306026.1 flagellar brake protein [Chromatiaceae bacterium]MCP5316059.1 flagellar brake protein [Chromatiaceae bacterium]
MTDDSNPLNLTIGSILQIQATVPENAPRYSVRLIGYLPGASLVVTTPTIDGKLQIVREAQRFTVRLLKGERVLGFVSQVLQTSLKPYPHLHLAYPDDYEQIVVRNASRVSADLPVLVRNTRSSADADNFHAATIVDLSETGAKIASAAPLASPNEILHLKFEIEISGDSEELGLLSDVRNVSERIDDESGRLKVHYTGVQFRTMNRFQQVLLHAWVTDHVLQQTRRVRRG